MNRPQRLSEEASQLLDAANNASAPATNAWLAFLALLAYLLVTLGGVRHKDLLLNSPVKLPIVNVDIPLFSFFQYAPVLVLLFYLSLLILHVMLAGKFHNFTEAIKPYEKKTGREHPARQLVYPYVVSQILAGPRRNFLIRWLMGLMVFVTFALLPVLTLLYFQVKFLPYHEVWITYWHRIAALLGLATLFAVLPIIHLRSWKREVKVGPQSEMWRASPLGIVIAVVFATVILGFSWLIATVPGERLEEGLGRLVGFVPPARTNKTEELLNPLVRAAYERIAQADQPNYESESWLLRWLMSYRVLVVEDTDLVPDESDKQNEVSVALRERDFRFARLSRSDLHRADLTEADLRGAVLREARLEKVRLPKAQLQNADLLLARLGGADLRQARLEGAMLAYARLEGAYLGWVRLQGGALPARLQGADLGEAHLQGAVLWQAWLQGASLAGAQLQGANLAKARLQGADLRQAQLQGANLARAQLQGADLRQAQLQGADLRQAQLQGADLGGAQLQGADFDLAGVWLAHSSGNPDQALVPLGLRQLDKKPLSADLKAELTQELQGNITDGTLLESLRKRLDPILRDDPPSWDDTWLSRYSLANDPSVDDYVRFLVKTACEDPGGHIAASMADRAQRYIITPNRELYGRPLAAALLAEGCEGAKAQTDEARIALKNIAAEPGALPQLGTELSATSVSGFSSGAYMAGQLQLAHSRDIVGAGLVAGGPFACAESDATLLFPFWPTAVLQNSRRAVSSCMQVSGGVPDPSALLSRAKSLAEEGQIDPLEGLAGDKVYLFSGDQDMIVVRDVVRAAVTFYEKAGLLDANIMFVRQPGGHAFLTEHNVPVYNITIKPVRKKERSTELEDFLTKLVRKEAILAEQEGRTCDISAPPFVTDCDYDQANITQVRKKTLLTEQGGLACGVSAPPFITDCAYNQAKAILEWIYVSNESPLARPSTEAQGSFIAFDQRQYAKDGDGFADDGVVYLPSSCQQQIGCRIHVALHGCDQSRETVGDAFIKESGFAEMADTNRFVILFPQTKATEVNPHGCWDWWGYTGLDYLGKGAPQIAAIWAMVEHLAKSPEVQP